MCTLCATIWQEKSLHCPCFVLLAVLYDIQMSVLQHWLSMAEQP